jgi:hypothetical protein
MGRALYSRDRSLSYLLACPWHEQHAAFYFKPRPKRQREQESLLPAKGPKTDSDDEERLSRDLRNLSRNRSQSPTERAETGDRYRSRNAREQVETGGRRER